MKDTFPGFYADIQDAIDIAIEDTLVVFDTNVLLNLYRYPSHASRDLTSVMEALAHKVWLPHQTALEYHRNRLLVIAEQKQKFKAVQDLVEKSLDKLQSDISSLQLKKRHSIIDTTDFVGKLLEEKEIFNDLLKDQSANHLGVTDIDPILQKLETIFSEKIGPGPINQDWLDAIFKDGTKRYALKIPPGYEDESKQGDAFTHGGLIFKREFGDLILWNQVIEHCNTANIAQLIFITDDDKEDWWHFIKSGGKRRFGPRPELTDELKRMTKVSKFFILNSDQFAQRFSSLLNVTLGDSTVQQVRDIRATLTGTEHVKCPDCGLIGTETLGTHPGSSAFHSCEGCSTRFHVNRIGDGQVITRKSGQSRAPVGIGRLRVEATCPKCDHVVPANITQGDHSTDRYCMNCCSMLTIDSSGDVLKHYSASPEPAASTSYEGKFSYLTCPECSDSEPIRTIWGNGEVMRAVCPNCQILIEAKVINAG